MSYELTQSQLVWKVTQPCELRSRMQSQTQTETSMDLVCFLMQWLSLRNLGADNEPEIWTI